MSKRAILRAINHFLQMFNSRSDGKGFGLKSHMVSIKHFKSIASRMSESENNLIAGQGINFIFFILNEQCFKTIIFANNITKFMLKAKFSAQGQNFMTQVRHDFGKIIGSDMRFRQIENIARCSGMNKFMKNFKGIGIFLNTGHELSVRKSTGTSFPELDIRFRIKHPVFPKQIHIFKTLLHGFTAFQDKRFQTGFRQSQSGKHTGRTASDHHGRQGRRLTRFKDMRFHFLNRKNIFVI